MRTDLRSVLGATLMFGLALVMSACPTDEKLPIGGSCNSGGECVSGICAGNVCLDPQGDDDGDTLINSLEQTLGSDPLNADTDSDGIVDGAELEGVSNVDTDGDGLADIIESATNDLDGDCITDQYDAENDVQNADLSPMRDVVCSDLGVCAGQDRALFGVLCPEGVAVCDYSNVVGYVDPEVSCDGVDDNCDGLADDGFPDRDADGIADCVDTDWDNDGVADDVDNCPFVENPSQDDAQDDGVGDACAADLGLAFTLAPIVSITAGAPFDVTVTLQDDNGTPVPRFHGDVALTLTDAVAVRAAAGDTANGATLTGTTTATAVDGVATFTGLVISPPATDLALTASSGDLGSGTSGAFDVVSGELAELRPTGAPATTTAGDALSVTLTAYDAYDNVLTTWAGTVSFSSSDPDAILPADYTFGTDDAGAHTFDGLALRTAGDQTLTVSDGDGATLATVEVTVESAAAASFGVAGLSETVTAGAATSVTVSARDAFGNVAGDYTGTVSFDVDDAAATVPADHSFSGEDAGSFTTTDLVLRTAGARTVTVGDGTLTGSAAVTVVPGEPSALVVEASPAPFTAGTPFSVTVTVVDAFGNVVTDYEGTVTLTSSDPLATLPSAYTFSAADHGVHVFTGVTLVSSGEHSVSASSSTGASVGGAVDVTIASGSDVVFAITGAPDPATAGAAFDVTVTVRDTFGNVVTDYVGTIALLSSDDAATLPSPVALTETSGGVATFSGVVLKTAGSQTLTAADTGQGISLSETVTVVAGAAASLAINGPSSVTAGTPFTVTVTAEDAYGNAATGYSATLAFSSSDEDATLPGDGTFPAGNGAQPYGGVAVTLAGAQTVTVTDPQDTALTATLDVDVSPAGAASVSLSAAPTTRVAGESFGLTATLYDAFGNVASGYTGQLAVSTSDPAGVVPAAHTFTAGDAGAFDFTGITLKTSGDQTVTVAAPGNGALTAQATVSVTPAAAATLTVTPSDAEVAAGVTTSVVVRADDAFGNRATGYTGTVHFSATDSQATLPVDYAFTGGDAGQHVFGGVVFRTVGAQTVTVTDVATASVTGQASVTVGQGAQIVYELTGLPTSTAAGTALTATLSVKDTFGNPITDYSGTVAFTAVDATSGEAMPGATLPPSYTFVSADGGSHVFTGIVLRTAGTTTVRAAEVGSTNVSASAVVEVAPAAMSRLAIDNAPASVTAGTAFGLRVTAYDAYDNVATSYTGPVVFSASREGATLPTDGTLTAGTRSFSGLVLTLAGDTSVTVADGEVSTSVALPVGHGAPASLALTALPSTVTAGVAQSLTATVHDTWGNVATSFTGSASVVTDDPALDPTSITFAAGDNGQRTFPVTFRTVGSRQVTVDAGGALSATRSTTVEPGAATRFVVSALPSTLTAGTQRTLTITLYDAYGNVATGGIAGAFTITSTDPAATIAPASLTIGPGDGGSATTDVTLVTAGGQTVTVAHTQSNVELTTTVTPAAAAKVAVSDLPPTMTAGVSTAVVVRVTDTYGNTVTNYAGVVNVSSSDDAVTLSPGASLTFPAGQPASVALTVTFETAGDQSLDFLDTGLGAGGVAATSTTVSAAAPRDLVATPASGDAVAGTAFDFTVAIYDAYGNLAPTYTGTVSFGSNDPQATLPADTGFGGFGGTHTFSATLRTAGTRVITCSGTGLSGASSDDVTRAVSASSTLDHFTVAPSVTTVTAGGSLSATVTPYDAFDNVITTFSAAVAMSVDDPDGTIPSPVTLSGATQVSPIKLFTAGTIHVTATYGGVSDSGAVTVVPAAPTRMAFTTQPSDGYVSTPLPTFAVAFYDAYDNVATNMPATTVALALGRNAGPGHLVATTAVTTSSGVATFSAAQIDAPGRGYDLIAGSELGEIRSDRFDLVWRPATLVGTPTVGGSGGCRDVNYTLAQANGHPADVLVEYRVGTGTWRRATQQAGTAADGQGTRGVATSAAGVGHVYAWDASADIGRNDATVTVRLTPVIDGVAGASKTTASFGFNNAWGIGGDKLVIDASINPGPVAVGDYDRNGLDDVLLMAADKAIVDVFFQTSPGSFTESSKQLDISQMSLVALAPWQPSPQHTKGFFALSAVDSQLFVFTRAVQGVGSVGWSWVQAPACPSPTTNTPTAMAVGEVLGTRDLDAVIACAGDGGAQGPTLSMVSYDGQTWGRGFDVGLSKIPGAVAVADLGHNGWRDIIVGDSGGLRTLISQYGDGFCQSSTCGAQVIEARAPTAIAVADFDNDGQLDVVTVDGGDVATFFRGDVIDGPQGIPLQYIAPQGQDIPLSIPARSVAARDVNDDGIVDVVVGSLEVDAVEILLGGDLASWDVREIAGGTGAGVNSLWIGDLDEDGRTDIVAGRSDTSNPLVGLLPGKPFQVCRASFETSGAARYMAGAPRQAVADVDGDGRHDAVWMATYNASVKGLMVGYGDGAGGFQRGYASYVTTQAPTDMALGDLDNDGLMDAVLNDGYTDNVDVALQSASEPGTFYQGYAPTYFNDAAGDSLVIVDADNDGLSDLFYLGAGALQRYYGNGDTVVAASPVALTGGAPTGLGHADVNKDGYQDFAYYGYVNDVDSVCLLLSTGPRSYATGEDCVAIDARDGRVQLVDLDGDGVEEMVYVSFWDYYAESLIAVRRQQTPDAGDFGTPAEVPTCFGGTDLRFADANADGRTDILLSCGTEGGGSSADAVMILYQGPDGSFGGTVGGFGTFGYQAWGLAVGDANGDLFDDVYLGATATRRADDGLGFVTPAASPASDGNYAYRLAVADLDGNGLLDAVTAGGQRFSVALQPEPGKLVTPTTYTLSGVSSVYGLAVDDVDGDGRPDVVLGVYSTVGAREVRVYRQTLSVPGTFDVDYGFTTLSPTGSGYPNVIVVEDFTAAGVPSVLVSQATYSSQDEFDVFLQSTSGSFTKIPSDPYTSTFPTQVVSAGFGWFGRGDYREPFVAGRCGSSPCVVIAQIGGCDLQPPICFKTKTTINLAGGAAVPLYTSISGAVVADVDKDGFDDIVASLGGNNGSHVYALVRQDPTAPGTFLAMQTFQGAQTTNPRDLRLVDIDHDGRLDIVAQYAAGSATAYEILLGAGTGASFGQGFAVATALSDSEGAFVVRDMDRDGWPDLLTLSPNDTELLLAPQR